MTTENPSVISLPHPETRTGMPLTEAIATRRSVREYLPDQISLVQLSQLLWAAQGITHTRDKLRAVPSAGASYPLEIFVVCGDMGVEKLESGIYHYEAKEHVLTQREKGDLRADLAGAAFNQQFIVQAPVNLIICAELKRTLMRYSSRGESYVYMEVGHAGQNIYLQAVALGLATCAIGAFNDDHVREVLLLEKNTRPLYILPVGKAK